MKIFICCSKYIYERIPPIKEILEKAGHTITLPNAFTTPMKELDMKKEGKEAHSTWKAEMLRLQGTKVAANDALVVLNMEKNGQQNYIGGATFLEIFKAFELGKKIFLYNPIPEGIFMDELMGINPTILHGDLSLVK